MFNFGVIATVLVISVLLIISGIKILKEYERAVIFRLGRLVQARGPGLPTSFHGLKKCCEWNFAP